MEKPNITFSSCLYRLKNRHGNQLHLDWFRNIIRIVNRFYLVIYTCENDYNILIREIQQLDENTQQKIKVVIKPFTEFYNYKYKSFWIENNNNPQCATLYNITDWRLNMLWCEKVHFVKQTIEQKYFDTTEYYGWCDIGYFRDIISDDIREKWPNPDKLRDFDKERVYYGCIIEPIYLRPAYQYHVRHFHPSNIDNITGVPIVTYPAEAHMFSGGCYITGREKAVWWCDYFQRILEKYIRNKVVVQNEQHIIAHCVFIDETNNFCIIKSCKEICPVKLWFMFREFLL